MKFYYLSFHIYYFDNHDFLLTQGIAPILYQLKQNKNIHSFFYIRYWQQGPHIRIRIKVNLSQLHKAKLFFLIKMNQFMKNFPSTFVISKEKFLLSTGQFSKHERIKYTSLNLANNNSIVLTTYEPELTKYGGRLGIILAENYFYKSSIFSLKLLKRKNYQREKLLLGILIMLISSFQFGFSNEESHQFFVHYFNYWRSFLENFYKKSNYVYICEISYKKIKKQILSLYAKRNFLFISWQSIIRVLNFRLNRYQASIFPHFNAVNHITPKHFLLLNYLHTHNNRCGIQMHEEAILAYWAQRFFEDLLISENETNAYV